MNDTATITMPFLQICTNGQQSQYEKPVAGHQQRTSNIKAGTGRSISTPGRTHNHNMLRYGDVRCCGPCIPPMHFTPKVAEKLSQNHAKNGSNYESQIPFPSKRSFSFLILYPTPLIPDKYSARTKKPEKPLSIYVCIRPSLLLRPIHTHF